MNYSGVFHFKSATEIALLVFHARQVLTWKWIELEVRKPEDKQPLGGERWCQKPMPIVWALVPLTGSTQASEHHLSPFL